MNKRRANTSKEGESSTDIVDEVISQISSEIKPQKKNRTLPLAEEPYNEFERICKAMDSSPSKVIDKFIAVFNARQSEKY